MWPTNDFNHRSVEEFMLYLEVERFIDENFDEETKALAETVEFL